MSDRKVTVVIPTLQKNTIILNKLISTLEQDNAVDEILLIDNSCQGFLNTSKKLEVVKPECNLYVNPSWNLGVERAKNEIVALLNDDIIIPDNFCSRVINRMSPEMGIVGMNGTKIESISDINQIPAAENIYLEPASYMDYYYGIAMFFYKTGFAFL